MEKYKFLVDGLTVVIYPEHLQGVSRGTVLDQISENELACIISPDLVTDFRIECFDKNNKQPREPSIVFAALFCFFKMVRAYPDMTLEFRYNGSVESLGLTSSEPYNFSVNIGKYKIISANKVGFPDGVSVEYCVVEGAKRYAVTLCHDSDLFDRAVLSVILKDAESCGAGCALALSASDVIRIKEVGGVLPSEAVAAAISVLSKRAHRIKNGRQIAYIDGVGYDLSYSPISFTFYPHVKYLS